ncbi:MAG: hypothetical protein HZC28_04835 [Spirochaetes bacterium]|nr:hypothetical protein [Spirochaetota bacterium]
MTVWDKKAVLNIVAVALSTLTMILTVSCSNMTLFEASTSNLDVYEPNNTIESSTELRYYSYSKSLENYDKNSQGRVGYLTNGDIDCYNARISSNNWDNNNRISTLFPESKIVVTHLFGPAFFVALVCRDPNSWSNYLVLTNAWLNDASKRLSYDTPLSNTVPAFSNYEEVMVYVVLASNKSGSPSGYSAINCFSNYNVPR